MAHLTDFNELKFVSNLGYKNKTSLTDKCQFLNRYVVRKMMNTPKNLIGNNLLANAKQCLFWSEVYYTKLLCSNKFPHCIEYENDLLHRKKLVLITKFHDNESLRTFSKRMTIEDPLRWKVIYFQISYAIAYLQSFGVVHGDLHPGNILLEPCIIDSPYISYKLKDKTYYLPNIKYQVKICDFGFSFSMFQQGIRYHRIEQILELDKNIPEWQIDIWRVILAVKHEFNFQVFYNDLECSLHHATNINQFIDNRFYDFTSVYPNAPLKWSINA